jgi:outer membrane translocation and assembly module TamA
MRFYLGGADTVRGWGLRRLSPQVFPDGCIPGEADCRGIPVGGNTMILANIEARVRATKMLSFVAFADGGDVRAGVNEFALNQFNYSAGPGVRLDTPIGVFRLDVGFRLNDTVYALGQKIWAVHFGLGEAF